MGFKNIKIYNGGLKDWKKSGYKIIVLEPLPEYTGNIITAEEFIEKLERADSLGCYDADGKPLLTILDFRTENFLETKKPIPSIKTKCNVIKCLLDDFRKPEVRDKIPRQGTVVLLCETGNRDPIAMRYLFKHGYTNIVGLQFGMRGLIKLNYALGVAQ